ncbi:MAG: endonuclease V [Methanosarcinaceae archaeon]
MASKIVVGDNFEPLTTVGGADCAFVDDSIICDIIVLDCKTLDVVERARTVWKVEFSYITTFPSFKEGRPVVNTLSKLSR